MYAMVDGLNVLFGKDLHVYGRKIEVAFHISYFIQISYYSFVAAKTPSCDLKYEILAG
jgi:hypothetical protein